MYRSRCRNVAAVIPESPEQPTFVENQSTTTMRDDLTLQQICSTFSFRPIPAIRQVRLCRIAASPKRTFAASSNISREVSAL